MGRKPDWRRDNIFLYRKYSIEEESAMSKILMIEDEKNILKSVAMYLEGHGYTVLVADCGLTGIKEAEQNIPDLIILDLVLPDIDGYTVCKTLREHPKTSEIPILIMSAKSQQNDIDKAFKSGANDYITKPFEPQVLIETINKVMKENVKP